MDTLVEPKLDFQRFEGAVEPDWCPGCGDYGVLNALKRAAAQLGLQPSELMVVSGIGCSSNLPGFINAYGVHSLHGRAVPVATGLKLANTDLKVVITGGDGDGYGIGVGHFIHAMRRNLDLTYIVMDNQIYGLTTGQTSPTTMKGVFTKTSPFGNAENPINPLALAIVSGATYVARGFSGNIKQLAEVIAGAIEQRASPWWMSSAPVSRIIRSTPMPGSNRAFMTSRRTKPSIRRAWSRLCRRRLSSASTFPWELSIRPRRLFLRRVSRCCAAARWSSKNWGSSRSSSNPCWKRRCEQQRS
jgi:hypothetical protein